MTIDAGQRLSRTSKPRNVGIVHLGLGAFFRAHGAIYLQEIMRSADREGSGVDTGDGHSGAEAWGVIGVSLRSPNVRDSLAPQGFVYTAMELSAHGLKSQTVDAVQGVLVAPESPEAVLDVMAENSTKIVSLTITEKGYCRRGTQAAIDFDHPDIQHDLQHKMPRSAPGFLVRALERRWQGSQSPFTVLSMDNLPANGQLTQNIVLSLASRINPALAEWVRSECRFPSTMVDRIVPATTDDMIERARRETGVFDPALVVHEPFRQWVVEDDFVGGIRPDLERSGVQLVQEVAPFESMKLRMLNGSHSALAYIGSLIGHGTVEDAIKDAGIERFIDALWGDEIAPSLVAPAGTDLAAYAGLLKMRYQNPEIRHLLYQIASDGSAKLPQRVLDPLFENHAAGRPYGGLLTVLAAWFRYVEQQVKAEDENGLNDPLKAQLTSAVKQASDDAGLTRNLLSLTPVFGSYPVASIEVELIARLEQIGLLSDSAVLHGAKA